LENNYEIKIATNTLSIEKQMWQLVMPECCLQLLQPFWIITAFKTVQIRQDGTKTELDNAKNNSLTYGVLDWTVLTECACCQTRSVKGITKLGEAQLKLTVITRSM
jgi:hypothetical protein